MRLWSSWMLLACLPALSLPGCISYSLDRLPPAPTLPEPLPPEQRPGIAWSMSTQAAADDQLLGGALEVLGPVVLREELPNALLRSGQFRTVEPKREGFDPELQLDVVLTVNANGTIVLASMMLLFVVPTWRTVSFDLTAEVRARDGRWQRYHLTDAARDICWLPFILGMSFSPWGDAYPEIRENLYRTLLAELSADGFLAGPR